MEIKYFDLDGLKQLITDCKNLFSKKDHTHVALHTHSNKSILDAITAAFTTQLKSNYDAAYTHSQSEHAPSNAQENVIETVKVNGKVQTPSDKAVDITVPTKVSELTNDSGFKTTDTWRGVQDNLTSSSTVDSLSANQGKVLKELVDGKAASVHSHTKSQISDFPISLKNPNEINIKGAGTTVSTYDGSEMRNLDIVAGNNITVSPDATKGKITISSSYTDTWRPLGTDADTACAGNDSRLSNSRPASDVYSWAKASSKPIYTWNEINDKPTTFTPSNHIHGNADITDLDCGKLTGTLDLARLPQGALDRLVKVADDTARFKLTSSTVQLGDTVKVTSTGKMYIVVDESKLSEEAGYEVYTADTATSVPWSGITGKPTSFTPSNHTHNYAGSSSVGGSATSAVKLDTTTAGSATQPVYFTGGKPTACTYTLGKSVPSNAVFTDTTYSVFENNVGGVGGHSGLVPTPLLVGGTPVLTAKGWTELSDLLSNKDYDASSSHSGLMPASMFQRLNDVATPTETKTYLGIS